MINYSSDSSTTKASALATRLQDEYSVKAITAKADIGSANGPAELVSIAREHFSSCSSDLPNNKTGGKPFQIDIIVNNAGIVLPEPVGSITLENFDAQYRINVRGPMLLVQAALPYLPTDRSGRIVNVSSIGSSIGFWYQTVYGGTKAAVEAMTRTWARELAERATVNAVNPGGIDTGMYGSLPQDMLEKLAPFNRLTPLAAVREGVDDEGGGAGEGFWGPFGVSFGGCWCGGDAVLAGSRLDDGQRCMCKWRGCVY